VRFLLVSQEILRASPHQDAVMVLTSYETMGELYVSVSGRIDPHQDVVME
jgi:hypothetical protein